MKPDQLLRAILPEVLIDNFDIERFEKSDTRFDIWLDEKKDGAAGISINHSKYRLERTEYKNILTNFLYFF